MNNIIDNDRYFGSDLNKFIHENCKKSEKGLVVINIDLAIHEYNNKIIRIIESKHNKEKIKTGQILLLKKLKEIYDTCKHNYKIEFYIVYADQPYELLTIKDLNNEIVKIVLKDEFIKWINCEVELNKIGFAQKELFGD